MHRFAKPAKRKRCEGSIPSDTAKQYEALPGLIPGSTLVSERELRSTKWYSAATEAIMGFSQP